MTDDHLPDHDAPGDDGREETDGEERDARLATLLAVDPLDDATRRRLVRTAVASAPPRRPRVALVAPVAAAVAIGIAIGALVVNHPDDTPPAALAPSPSVSAAAPAPRAPSGSTEAAPGAAAPGSAIGNLGEVANPTRLRAAIARARARGAASSSADAAAIPCGATRPDALGLLVVASVGTGTVRGAAVVVLVGTEAGGGETAVVLYADGCAQLERVALQPS